MAALGASSTSAEKGLLMKNRNTPQKFMLTIDKLNINFAARTVDIAGERIALSPREYELLFYMRAIRGEKIGTIVSEG